MTSAEFYREKARAIREKAKATPDQDEAFAYLLRAIEFEAKAEDLEHGQVRQGGNQEPPAPPLQEPARQQQQQQQQVQPNKEDD